jgi:hypothetical protein
MLLCHRLMPPNPHPQPPTKETIVRDFHARPVTRQNLFDWRRGGCQEWMAIQALLFQSATRNQRKPSPPGQPPIVPDQASIVLKRAKTRYFFTAQPCHYLPVISDWPRLHSKGDAAWTEDSVGESPTETTGLVASPKKPLMIGAK